MTQQRRRRVPSAAAPALTAAAVLLILYFSSTLDQYFSSTRRRLDSAHGRTSRRRLGNGSLLSYSDPKSVEPRAAAEADSPLGQQTAVTAESTFGQQAAVTADIIGHNDGRPVDSPRGQQAAATTSVAGEMSEIIRVDDERPVEYSMVYPGNGGSGWKIPPEPHVLAHVGETHGIRCCADAVYGPSWSEWYKTTRGAEWCPLTYRLDKETDCHLATFRLATEFCASREGRLCTPDELKGRCAIGSGCGFDMGYVWAARGDGIVAGDVPGVPEGGGGGDAPAANMQNDLGGEVLGGDAPVWEAHDGIIAGDVPEREGGGDAPAAMQHEDLGGGEPGDAPAAQIRGRPSSGGVAPEPGGYADASPAEEIRGRRPLIHVFSPYHERAPNPFSPLDFEQWTVLVSVRAAQEFYHSYLLEETAGGSTTNDFAFDSVVVVCPILESDAEAIRDVLIPYCDQIEIMTRSTATQYPQHNVKALPFLQEIVDAGRSVVDPSGDEYHLMMSNADIILTPEFYKDVEAKARRRRRNADALSFNRKTIDLEHLNMPDESFPSQHDAALEMLRQGRDALSKKNWRVHAGFDCFVFRSSFLDAYNFGDMFAGYPWWSVHTDLALNVMANGYMNGHSDMFPDGGTVHFGNEMNWRHGANDKETLLNPSAEEMTFWKDFGRDELEYLMWCPMIRYPPYDVELMLNSIECGRWFKPPGHRPNGGVPAFVNDGHEERYLNGHTKYVEYKGGIPVIRGRKFQGGQFRNSTPKEKRRWIEKWG